MMRLGAAKKTVAVLLCISTVSVMFILNTQLRSSPRRRTRYETRHTLSVPLTLDLSKNVTFLRLPDANNEVHRYKLERIHDEDEDDYWAEEEEEEKEEEEMRVVLTHGEPKKGREDNLTPDADTEDNFGDRIDGEQKGQGNASTEIKEKTQPTKKRPAAVKEGNKEVKKVDIRIPASGVNKDVLNKSNYLLTVADPRYPRMIAKVLSKLPFDVKRDMTVNIRIAEARSKVDFMKLPVRKQWEVILKVFGDHGYHQRFPDIINIGVKKSGTNALGFFLPQHPQIVHSIGNEVHYFDWMYSKGLDYYKSRMGFGKSNQFIFEKTPRYYVTPEAPKRIKADLPTNPKFILCVRDPIERLISDFRHESELTLRKEFKKDRLKYASRSGEYEGLRLRQQILDNKGQVNASNELVSTSVYVKHYKNWLSYFPPERLLIVDQDRMEKDVYTEMKRLELFLGLKPFFRPSMFYFDKDRNGVCMRETHIPQRNCPAKSTPSVLPKAVIDEATLAKLKEFYRPLNREFSQMTGLTFAWAD